jgi:hypothetical protein
MTKSNKQWPEPKYRIAQKEHLHAIGVLVLNYNAFESALFDIFVHHLDRHDVPQRLAKKLYFEMQERKRLDFVKVIFSAYERNPHVKVALTKLLKYFEWCADTRNRLVHAKYSPPLFGVENNKLYLAKRVSQRSLKLHYMQPSLRVLRNAADHIRVGLDCCVSLHFHLKLRDTPQEERSLALRASALGDPSPPPLPEIPPPPKKLRKSLVRPDAPRHPGNRA